MARLSKDAWNKPSLKTREVEVEELGGSVLVRELPAEYAAEVASNFTLSSDGRDQVAKVDTATMERLQFAFGVIGDDGEPMFTEAEAADIAKHHGRAFRTVIAAIDEMSGVDKEEIEKTTARFPSGGETPQGNDGGSDSSGSGGSGGDGAPPGRRGSTVPARTGARAGDAG